MDPSKVVVIGAGIAGLTAARELGRRGINVVVLEALPHVGGRVRTIKQGKRNYDLGASWFHEIGYNALYKVALKQKWNLHFDDALFEFVDSKGVVSGNPDPQKITETFQAVANERSLDSLSLKDLATIAGVPELRLYEHWVGMPWEEIPAAEAVEFMSAKEPEDEEEAEKMRDAFNLSGNSTVIEWIKCGIDKNRVQFHFDEPVENIALDKKFSVRTPRRTIIADAVVCTIPLGALKSSYSSLFNGFALPPALDHAIREGTMAALGKVVLEFDSCFWNNTADRFEVTTDPPVFFTNPFKNSGGPPTLVALIAPPLTQLIENAPERAQELLTPALKALSGGKDVPKATRVICTDWTTNKYFGGSYSGLSIGQSFDTAIQPFTDGFGLLRFAGEHTQIEGLGCMHGAYESGLREANHIAKELESQNKHNHKL